MESALLAAGTAIDWQSVASVTTIASAMPIMPSMLPRRLVTGLDSPRSVRMKRTPETM